MSKEVLRVLSFVFNQHFSSRNVNYESWHWRKFQQNESVRNMKLRLFDAESETASPQRISDVNTINMRQNTSVQIWNCYRIQTETNQPSGFSVWVYRNYRPVAREVLWLLVRLIISTKVVYTTLFKWGFCVCHSENVSKNATIFKLIHVVYLIRFSCIMKTKTTYVLSHLMYPKCMWIGYTCQSCMTLHSTLGAAYLKRYSLRWRH